MSTEKSSANLQRRLRSALRIIENIPDDGGREFILEMIGDYERLSRRERLALDEHLAQASGFRYLASRFSVFQAASRDSLRDADVA